MWWGPEVSWTVGDGGATCRAREAGTRASRVKSRLHFGRASEVKAESPPPCGEDQTQGLAFSDHTVSRPVRRVRTRVISRCRCWDECRAQGRGAL